MDTLPRTHSGLRVITIQVFGYLASGGVAAILAIVAYAILIRAGLWYVSASVVSDGVGFLSTFLFHKYLVFEKREGLIHHVARFTLLQVANTVIQAMLLYALVEFTGMDKILARILSIGFTVPWNFLLYKYVVYI
ncbi:hypothetical protein A3D88_01480 [Candidatus Peribacteria bacterium RIFCSPHIGHO2_02_FULL_52_16]|nr:MAG: hypothetical protein A2706_03720 [Candidatus Peribacteria bacterium RIFCSPHIGHO2_01_FULL_51_35]OGJ60991.1 MAG: hypothetical protein A3D88_01480 [Candidatus Peribacteria bacterium RIFCSPHIGHO2_02_FULL_52_16]